MAFSKYSDLDPVVLFKDDLLELEQLFRKFVTCTGCDFIIHAKVQGHDISAEPFHSLESIVQAKFPAHVDQLDFNAREVSEEGRIVKYVRVLLDVKSGDVRFHHESDQDWVASASKEFVAFFRARRPWYAGVKRVLAPLYNISMVFALMMAAPPLLSGRYWMLIFPIVFLVYSLNMLILGLKDRLFPYSRIGLYSAAEDQRRPYELWAVATWVLVFVVCVSGTLLFM
jgi:hypothetical protein